MYSVTTELNNYPFYSLIDLNRFIPSLDYRYSLIEQEQVRDEVIMASSQALGVVRPVATTV